MKPRSTKPLGGIGPGQGLSVRQALTARNMRRSRLARAEAKRKAGMAKVLGVLDYIMRKK